MGPLLKHQQGAAFQSAREPGRIRLNNYTLALESVVGRCLESENPVREELKVRKNDREIRKLRKIFDISDVEHEEILSVLLGENNLALREALGLLEEIAEDTAQIRALASHGAASPIPGVELLIHNLTRRRRNLGLKFLSMLRTVPESHDGKMLARWFNVFLSGQLLDVLDFSSPDFPGPYRETVPSCLLDIFREDINRSMEILNADESDKFGTLRSQLSNHSHPYEYLAQTARGSETVPAAVALFVLAQLDPGRGRELAESTLATASHPWLVEEVALSIAAKDAAETAKSSEHRDSSPDGDYEIEPVSTINKMLYLFKCNFFQPLGLDVLASIARGAELRIYRRGGIVCRIGERSDRVFVVCRGSADVCLPRDGGYKWVDVVGEGDSIGELGVITQKPRSATVIVNRDGSKLISINDGTLLAVLNQNANAAMSFLRLLSGRHQAILAKM
jgi:hypothetical protein